ncbi:unnamed protein product [Paramecium primaurelia]|uniref:Kelch motif family protein n=1 Tax=Paramecium primaurelia TaxID=5886 RepID=A0A8S1MVG4_PARPR|nr:unnamed protein product [Paramecium primaurelia]
MSFRDLENPEQAVFISQDLLNESFSQISQEQNAEQQQEFVNNNEIYPQFSQTQNSHILSEIINTPSQPKLQTKKSILLPQSGGLFSYLIDNQSRIYDIFQNFLHRLFQYYFIKKVMDQNIIQNYIDLQAVKRKLSYVQQVYNQTFCALKNSIQYYQDKILILTSEIDKEDPYSLLTQHEIDLRRGLHDFYQFIDSEDLLTSSKGMGGSQNISQYKTIQIEVFNPADLNSLDKVAQFVLNSIELEQINITPTQLMNDNLSLNLLKITMQLLQIWQHLFRFLNQNDVSNIQFNYEVDQANHNAAIVAAQTFLLVPLDIANKILKGHYKELINYHLNSNNKLPLKEEYEKKKEEKGQAKLQYTLHFDKTENLIKIADDALTNEAENFSFSNAEHSLMEEQSDQQQTIQKYNHKYQLNSEQYKQTILDQAVELSFKGKINESHLLDIQPPKHRSYITESGQQLLRITPITITTLNCHKPIIEFNHINYFIDPQKEFLHYFKPNTKYFFQWQIDAENVQKIICDVEHQFTNELISFASKEGIIFLFNPFSQSADNAFYRYNEQTSILQALPNMIEKKRNFRVAQIGHYIYLIGGENQNKQVSNTCERFSLKTLEWQKIKSIQTPLTKVNLVVFQQRYLVRFGGLNRFDHFDKTIEKYDTKRHKWYQIKLTSGQDQIFKLNSVCLQINFNSILIFGGQNDNDCSDAKIQLLTIDEVDKKKNEYVAHLQELNIQQQFLSFIGQYDLNVYYQHDRIYLFRKNYSSLLL